jgi:hypothetical protein
MRFARLVGLALLVALVAVPAALAIRFSDGSLLPPTGVEGQPYFHKLDGAGGCDEHNYEFRVVSGGLPPGLRLVGEREDWRIEGTPTAAGSYGMYLEMWSDCEPQPERRAQRDITINIAPGLKIQQSQANVPTATVGVPYGPLQFAASGGGSQSWSATGVPPGMTFSSAGVLAGTPTQKGGDFGISVRVQDTSGRFNVLPYKLPVRDQLALTVPPVPKAEVGRPFTMGFTAAGGNEAFTWEATGLPDGLTFDATKATITGAPAVAGTATAKVTVKDQEGRVVTKDVAIVIAPKLTITTVRLKAGKVGKAYRVTFKARGGVAPTSWRLIRFRPGARAVTFDRTTGALTFVPGVARTYTITVRAFDVLKAVATQTVTLKVKA